MMPGPWELILILLIVVMVFGAKRIPEIMGGLGKGIKSFKKSMEIEDEPSSAAQTGPVERPKDKNELK
jgi:sec-independent protein translocase protein TatA